MALNNIPGPAIIWLDEKSPPMPLYVGLLPAARRPMYLVRIHRIRPLYYSFRVKFEGGRCLSLSIQLPTASTAMRDFILGTSTAVAERVDRAALRYYRYIHKMHVYVPGDLYRDPRRPSTNTSAP